MLLLSARRQQGRDRNVDSAVEDPASSVPPQQTSSAADDREDSSGDGGGGSGGGGGVLDEIGEASPLFVALQTAAIPPSPCLSLYATISNVVSHGTGRACARLQVLIQTGESLMTSRRLTKTSDD